MSNPVSNPSEAEPMQVVSSGPFDISIHILLTVNVQLI